MKGPQKPLIIVIIWLMISCTSFANSDDGFYEDDQGTRVTCRSTSNTSKYDSTGQLKWTTDFQARSPFGILLSMDDGPIIVSNIYSNFEDIIYDSPSISFYRSGIAMEKYDMGGQQEWSVSLFNLQGTFLGKALYSYSNLERIILGFNDSTVPFSYLFKTYNMDGSSSGDIEVPAPTNVLSPKMKIDNMGNIIISMIQFKFSQQNNRNAVKLIKIDSMGQIIWTVDVGEDTAVTEYDLAVDSSGNFLLVYNVPNITGDNLVVTKLDPSGEEIWRIDRYEEDKHYDGIKCRIDAEDSLYVGKICISHIPYTTKVNSVTKYDSNGLEIWDVSMENISGAKSTPLILTPDNLGNAAITGYFKDPEKYTNIFLTKFDQDGAHNLLIDNGAEFEDVLPSNTVADQDGNFYISYYQGRACPKNLEEWFLFTTDYCHSYLKRISRAGSPGWKIKLGDQESMVVRPHLAVDSDGSIIVSSTSIQCEGLDDDDNGEDGEGDDTSADNNHSANHNSANGDSCGCNVNGANTALPLTAVMLLIGGVALALSRRNRD